MTTQFSLPLHSIVQHSVFGERRIVSPNFRSAVVELLCSAREQKREAGLLSLHSASPSVGQRLPPLQQVAAQILQDFHRFLERLPSGQCATSSHPLILHMFAHQQWRGLKKENNLWNKWEVTKWPIINCCYFLCFCFEEIIIKVDVGLKDISIIPMMHNHPKQHELIR